MNVIHSPELEEFRSEVKRLIAANWRIDMPLLLYMDTVKGHQEAVEFRRKLGRLGLLSQSWPKQYGGQERRFLYEYVLTQELAYHEAPYNNVAIGIVAPVLMKYGSEEQKASYLNRIASGEIEFSLGYSEPDAGTDLAGLITKAERTVDGWVISGTKLWTSGAHKAEYCWLAARTGSRSDGRNGISIFIVDLESPQVEVRPVWVMDGRRTNEVLFKSLVVPLDSLVGEVNKGWTYITDALAYERFMAFPVSRVRASYERLLDQLIDHGIDVASHEAVGQLTIGLQTAELLSDQLALLLDQGELSPGLASVLKIFITEYQQEFASTSLRLLGERALAVEGSDTIDGGHFEYFYRYAIMPTFGGGTNDVIRRFVARLIHDLPETRLMRDMPHQIAKEGP